MRFSNNWRLWLALKYVFSRKRERFTGIIAVIAVLGVALSVGALTVVNAVITGFREAVAEKILSLNPHITITFWEEGLTPKIKNLVEKEIPKDQLVSLQETSSIQGLIIARSHPIGIVLKASNLDMLAKEKGFKVFYVEKDFLIIAKEQKVIPVVVGKKLRDRLGLGIGEVLNFMSAQGMFTPFGFMPKILDLKVVGWFETGVYDFDLNLVFAPSEAFFSYLTPTNRSLEIKLKDPFKSGIYKDRLLSSLGLGVQILDWQEWNKNLFAALKMEKLGLFVVLSLMIAVSLFTIIAAMIMLVSEKKMDIAILRALGASSKDVIILFFYSGFLFAVIGVLLGLMLGGSLCWVLSKYPVVKLPSDVYPVEYMPVSLKFFDLLVIVVVSLLISLLACLYPAKKASEVMPAEVLRHG
ncbi:FtsX-like permease family protein [Thermodesulfobacterium hveragerdense]|uniref:FtsX-like permease family protein n=1 Tax=Thermodesulfobacterium hveragerdense TaxID=53424 RepID=UPI000429C513|nr:FtsX-like permease family protein [Thermodesulfobacterium hveragerdense]